MIKPAVYAVCGIFGQQRDLFIRAKSEALTAIGTKHIIISADMIRDELYKDGKDFSTLYSLIVERIKFAIDNGHDVILNSDNSGMKKYLWFKAKFGIFQKIIFLELKQNTFELWENIYSFDFPWYFKNHRGPEWQKYNVGQERGLAVAKLELSRHLKVYRNRRDNLVYRNFW